MHSYRVTIFSAVAVLLLMSGTVVSQSLKSQYPLRFTVRVSNNSDLDRREVPVFIEADQIGKTARDFNARAFVVLDGDTEIPAQFMAHDSSRKGIIVVLDRLSAREARKLEVRYARAGTVLPRTYTKRTQAELAIKEGGRFENRKYVGGTFRNVASLQVPPEVTDHSYYIRYEGPGWESDKVGYRFYMDWRRGTDVFGKKTPGMVLQEVGLDGYESYHHMQPWGMDVMKVGNSLGLGSPAMFHHGKANRIDVVADVFCEVAENGDLFSSVFTRYTNWAVDSLHMSLESRLGICAGTRLTHHVITLTSGDAPPNLCTGIVKDDLAPQLLTSNGGKDSWGYIATYGPQSLNKDNLGLVVFFNPQNLLEITGDKYSHVVKLKPADGKLDYYFGAAWELEPEGIKTEEEFVTYINKTARELGNPVKVEVSR